MDIDPRDFPEVSFRNKKFSHLDEMGCYFCTTVQKVADVDSYTDDGETMLCPTCGVDSLVPVTEERLLVRGCEMWFTGQTDE